MGQSQRQGIRAEAIEWHIRVRDGDVDAWESFVLWLEQDSAHGEAYDAVEQDDLAIDTLLRATKPQPYPQTQPQRVSPIVAAPRRRAPYRWGIVGGALAASIALALVVVPRFSGSRYDIATGAGEQRTIVIDAGTEVTLNGSTRLTLDHRDRRYAALEQGEALFRVRHDAAAPFQLHLGEDRIEDVGTVFNVVRQPDEVRVAVAEGAVTYNPGREAVALRAGDRLVDATGPGPVQMGRAEPTAIGGWRAGRLSYADEPLARVAADLGRSLGVQISVPASMSARRFSGTLQLDKTGTKQLARLAPVLQVAFRPSGDSWTMEPPRGASH